MTTRTATADPMDVARLFARAMHALMHGAPRNDLASMVRSGLTLPQIIALHHLRDGVPRTVSEMAACSRLSPAAASHMVDRLVRQGLLTRQEDAEDRRQKRLAATPEGTALVDTLMNDRLDAIASALELLQPATRRKVAAAMEAVVADLSATGHGPEVHP